MGQHVDTYNTEMTMISGGCNSDDREKRKTMILYGHVSKSGIQSISTISRQILKSTETLGHFFRENRLKCLQVKTIDLTLYLQTCNK